MKKTVLVVDDERSLLKAMRMTLEGTYAVLTAENGADGLFVFQKQRPDLVLLDIGLPDMDGLSLLKQIRKSDPAAAVIMITAVDRVRTVVQAVQAGAYDYLVKPLDAAELDITLRNALEKRELKERIQNIQRPNIERYRLKMIGQSSQIHTLLEMARKVSRSPETPVLIVGESGTGKGVLARAIHYQFADDPGPFVTVNTTAITRELFESELFGYEPGAFTGAKSSGRTGYFEQAAGGTLFLDEIGSMSLEDQAKLLGVIEDRSFYRVGGSKSVPVSSRIVAATNTRLREAVEQGRFRNDLYYRLKVVELRLPPLRDRVEDIGALTDYFVKLYNEKLGKSVRGIAPEARQQMREYAWPGNVRELRNTIERIMLLESGDMILPRHLGFLRQEPDRSEAAVSKGKGKHLNYEETVRSLIREALEQARGNVLEAARLLKLPPHKLRYRIKKYGLQPRSDG